MRENFKVDRLQVSSINDRKEMGEAAASEVREIIQAILKEKEEVNIIFASSPFLMDVYAAMLKEDIPWGKINAFHMDEYIGITMQHKASFASYLKENFFNKVELKNVFYMDGMIDPQTECDRYADLLCKYPVDLTLLGIGTNGHLAFNDPFLADFFDDKAVKINPNMDDICRAQQITDGWFESVDEVPQSAITITIPALLKAPYTVTAVPGVTKKGIVQKTLEGPVCIEVPATALRLHRNARLFIDGESSALLTKFDIG